VTTVGAGIGLFLGTIRSTIAGGQRAPLDPPSLDVLRRAGIPVVSDEEFAEALARERERRCLLAGLLYDDGWSEEAWRRRQDAATA
jgi:hypothetical protein